MNLFMSTKLKNVSLTILVLCAAIALGAVLRTGAIRYVWNVITVEKPCRICGAPGAMRAVGEFMGVTVEKPYCSRHAGLKSWSAVDTTDPWSAWRMIRVVLYFVSLLVIAGQVYVHATDDDPDPDDHFWEPLLLLGVPGVVVSLLSI